MKNVLALFALLFAVSAQAATLKIKVEGSYDTVSFGQATSAIDYSPVKAVYDVHSPDLDGAGFNDWSRAHTGIAFLEDNAYSNCSGLLIPLCYGTRLAAPLFRGGQMFTHATYDYWLMTGVGETAIFYEDDSEYGFPLGDDLIYAPNGATMGGTIRSYTVSTVPLPASGLLLASLMLVALRRRR